MEEHPLAGALAPDDLLPLQRLEVARGARLRPSDPARQVADAALAARKLAHQVESRGIAEAGHEAPQTRRGVYHCT
jgi:hypothetical protein